MGYRQGDVEILWGSSVTGITYAGSGSIIAQSEDTTKESDMQEIKQNGETVGLYYYNYRQKLSLSVIPAGSTANTVMPTIGETVTVASSDSSINGTWILEGCSRSSAGDKFVELKLDLVQYASVTAN